MDPSWQIQPSHPEFDAVATRLALHPGAAAVLLNRGVSESMLNPRLADLHDPSALADLDRAVDMLARAVAAKTPICVYGDYDVDGTSSTAILVENLQIFGATVGYYLPHRLLQGYGLHKEAVEEIASRGFKMIVTVDLGISNGEEVAYAKHLGLDVIVIDHHQVPERLPIADAVINPHRPDDQFPFKPLCAAGVAFHVLIALRRVLGRKDVDLRNSLDLVALATVADMVSLTGLNRILVARGIDVLRAARRPGLAALARVAGVDPAEIDAQALGFRLGPRVNAAGRMGSAMRCVELFLADGIAATDMASRLDQENAARRSVEEGVLHRAERQADVIMAKKTPPAALLVFGDEWHPGVIGIVASRLVEKHHVPTLVIGQGGKGSGRSVPGVSLLDIMKGCSDHFVKFGGHHAAAGCTMKEGQGEALRATFEARAAEVIGGGAFVPTLAIDAVLDASHINETLVTDLAKVGPFGMGNPEPLFALKSVRIDARRQVGDGHLKLTLDGGLSAIAFRQAAHPAASADFLDLAFTPFISRYKGQAKVELRVKSLRFG